MWHGRSLGAAGFGMYALRRSQAIAGVATLATLYEWLWLCVLTLYAAYCLAAAFVFYLPTPRAFREVYMPTHLSAGIIVYTSLCLQTAVMVVQLNTANQCVTKTPHHERDYDPAEHYNDLPMGCRIGNGVGMSILATMLCTVFADADLKHDAQVRANARLDSLGAASVMTPR